MLKNKQNKAMFAAFGIILVVSFFINVFLRMNGGTPMVEVPFITVGLCTFVFTIFWYIRVAIVSYKFNDRKK